MASFKRYMPSMSSQYRSRPSPATSQKRLQAALMVHLQATVAWLQPWHGRQNELMNND